MTTLAREFDACGECRLEIGGPKKYRNLTNEEIVEVVEALESPFKLRTEAWMVLVRRKDDALPDPVKVCYRPFEQGLHWTLEEAQTAHKAIEGEMPYGMKQCHGVFRVEIEVMAEVK